MVHDPDGYSLRTQVWVDGAVLQHDSTSRPGCSAAPSGRWLVGSVHADQYFAGGAPHDRR